MFTGLIEDVGEIKEIKRYAGGLEISIKSSLEDIEEGESISIDGVCLTAKKVAGNVFTVDCSQETLRVTTLRNKKEGGKVNIERAMKPDKRFGGHFVLGHVDGIGKIKEKRREGASFMLTIEIPKELSKYLIRKGSIAIDGISLTVNDVNDNKFTVNIIPYTAIKTTLMDKEAGEMVNIEVDIIGKYVENFVKEKGHSMDFQFLKNHGFIEEE